MQLLVIFMPGAACGAMRAIHAEASIMLRSLLQDDAGQLPVRLFFTAGPTQAALALRVGHAIALGGVLAPPAAAAQQGASGAVLQTTWHEVRSRA